MQKINKGTFDNLGDLLSLVESDDHTVFVDMRQEDVPIELSAEQLRSRVLSIASGLSGLGVVPGNRIGFLSANRWEMLAGYLAVMYIGAVAVPINYKFPQDTVNYIIEEAGIQLILHDMERQGLIPSHVRSIDFDDEREFATIVGSGSITAFSPKEDDLAQILFTSGSTGKPKGVPLTHSGQIWALKKYIEDDVTKNSPRTSIIVAPMYHMNAIVFSCVCLLNQITIVSQPQFNPRRYVELVAEYRCSYLTGVPAMLAMVAALSDSERPADLSCVKHITIGSAPLSTGMLRRFREVFPDASITNGYGTTEAGPALFGEHPEGISRPPLSIGYPLEDIEWRLVGGSGDVGVLEVKTAAMCKGYLNRPEASRDRFKDGWYNTNDIMRRDREGFFYFVSRADDMFVCSGENIYPAEVEEILDRHPAVEQSVVVPAPDDIRGAVPAAFIIRREGAALEEDELRSFALENGPAYAHPRIIVFKSSFPLGGTNKIDRMALAKEAEQISMSSGRAT